VERKNRPIEERKAERESKAKEAEFYNYAVVDNSMERVANFLVEPPGLFRGRGEHPRAGLLKTRLTPEDITISAGRDNIVPKCPVPGHSWGNVVHNDLATWLSFYKDPNLDFANVKYVYLSAASKFKGEADKKKYEKARKLKGLIENVREDYSKKMSAESIVDKQLGCALYLIDKLALRIGNEKTEDEADTVGCCSLRIEHVSFPEQDKITLDFLGKDSMRYHNTVTVDSQVWECLKAFANGKGDKEELFDRISTSSLNDYLKSFMPGLSAKVFRTFNASITLETELNKLNITKSSDLEDKVGMYNDANRQVAILCNH